MSLSTFSKFYYGHRVDRFFNWVDFDEGGPEINVEMDVGSYTLTEFCEELAGLLSNAGGQAYTVTVNRTTRLITISAPGNFSLKVLSGAHTGNTIFALAGFTTNKTGSNSYTGDLPSGYVYSPQFILQDYVAKENFKKSVDATKNKTASGRVEVVRFGVERFFQMDIQYATDRLQTNELVIKNNPSGVADLNSFMDYITDQNPVEFIPNENAPDTFSPVLLESGGGEGDGTGYKLKEAYDRGLPGFFSTGTLIFRVVN